MTIGFLTTCIIISIAAALLGVFVILRRMALVSDVLSHVALPGMAIAFLTGVNPFFGAFAALCIVVTGIFFLERKFALSIDAIVGVAFTVALAIGMLITPKEDLGEALFGNIGTITRSDMQFAIPLGLALIALVLFFFRRFAHATFSKELFRNETAADTVMEFLFLVSVACAIALGIKVAGTLLMGALLILPAVTAKNIGWSLKSMTVFSVMLGVGTMVGGVVLSQRLSVAPGAAIILIGGACFTVSLVIHSLSQRTM